jgi:hypothetical protein
VSVTPLYPPEDSAFDADALDERNTLAPTPFEWIDPTLLPKRQWLYGRHLIRKYVSTTIAPGGLGKSSLIIAESLCMASGRGLLGEYIAEPLRVWYWNGEDGQDENRYRMVAAASHHKISPDAFASRLFHDTGREKEITIGANDRGGFTINNFVVDEIIRHIIDNHIDVLIVDPFVAVHTVGENDNGAINAIVRAFARIAEFGNCAVELVHHIRKPGAGVSADTDVNDARGASALIGGVRSARVLNAMSKDEAATFGIEDRFAYFRVDNGKANLAPRSDDAVWRHIVGYDLGNGEGNTAGDSIGVVEAWELPGIFAGTPRDALAQAQRIFSAGKHHYDVRSPDWAGYSVSDMLGLDPEEKEGKARIRKIIEKWIETGGVEKYNMPDKNRRPRYFIRSDEPDAKADFYE